MRVLIVEDETDLRVGLAGALRDEGYAVDEAGDGDEGVYHAETWDYDAILLDVMLPCIDGWGVLEKVRHAKDTPVLMLTARDTLMDRVKGLDHGADDYVLKPFELDELFARLRAIIRRSNRKANSILEVNGVSINVASRKVAKGGLGVDLTATEYSLVEYLAMRRGTVVSRTDLYDHLFDENEHSLSNLLDVHVSNIRKKLGHDFILTRRGHGYIIE